MEIKPGRTVDIIIEIDYRNEIVETKNSIVHDVIGDRMVIAQTDPPISRTRTDKKVYVTYLEREGGKPVRCGFPAKIGEFIKDYEVSSREKTRRCITAAGTSGAIQPQDALPTGTAGQLWH